MRIPNPHLPVVAATGLDRRAAIGNVHGLIGIDLSAVPNIGVILGQQFSRTGHADFICRLPGPATRILELPRKPRVGDVDSKRLRHALALQVAGCVAVEGQRIVGKRSTRQEQKRKQECHPYFRHLRSLLSKFPIVLICLLN